MSTTSEISLDSYTQMCQDIFVLLIGKTGMGKSALGNSILGFNAFESKPSFNSVTTEVTSQITEVNGIKIKVVDGPGVGDTRMNDADATEKLLSSMSKAISLSPEGYDAFLLVIKFGNRMTAEDKETFDILKKIFGKKFFKKFFVIVITGGDYFENALHKDNDEVKGFKNFKDWVAKEATGTLAEILKECNYRILLFDNCTQDKVKKQRQLNELLHVIFTLKKQNCRYSDDHFHMALRSREFLLVEANRELIEENIMDELNLILQKLQNILATVDCHLCAPLLKELFTRADNLYQQVLEKDNGTGVLTSLIESILSTKLSINDKIILSENVLKETKIYRAKLKTAAAKHAEELKRQREEFNKLYQEGRSEDEKKIALLQQQVDDLIAKRELWGIEENQISVQFKTEWDVEKQKANDLAQYLKELRDKQTKKVDEQISQGVLAKLKQKFSSQKNKN